jgi:peptidoglycan-associated lipoprotein
MISINEEPRMKRMRPMRLISSYKPAKQLATWVVAAAAFALLSACGSSVKLDPPAKVESRSPGTTTAPPASTGANTGAAGQTAVTPVDVTKAADTKDGPAGVGKSIYFDYDSFVIKDEFKPLVDAHAKFLKANTNRKSNLEGHTDERGGSEYNLALGQKRADAVRRALVLLGVSDAQLEATSFGKERPKGQGSNEAAWAENRRVDFSYR